MCEEDFDRLEDEVSLDLLQGRTRIEGLLQGLA